jgi:hypothetical protein
MASHIARRKFLATLGGAAAAWPLAAGTQGERVPRIVFLHALAENDPEVQTRVIWTQRNIQVEHRFSAGDFARMQAYSVEIVSSAPD